MSTDYTHEPLDVGSVVWGAERLVAVTDGHGAQEVYHDRAHGVWYVTDGPRVVSSHATKRAAMLAWARILALDIWYIPVGAAPPCHVCGDALGHEVGAGIIGGGPMCDACTAAVDADLAAAVGNLRRRGAMAAAADYMERGGSPSNFDDVPF